MAPTSQKFDDRPISFWLQNDGATVQSILLNIRPEDLTRSEPSLLTPVQTFKGAWIDDFGPGLSTIQISGHTGWRTPQGSGLDGVQGFALLRDTVFTQWHDRRADAVAAGKDPDTVKLIFVDKLDDICAPVAPGQFVLRRSRTRPLLMMYQLTLTILADRITDPTTDPLNVNNGAMIGPNPDLLSAGSDSLGASLDYLSSRLSTLPTVMAPSALQSFSSFTKLATQGISSVLGAVNAATGLIDGPTSQLVGVVGDLAMVGRNALWHYSASNGPVNDALQAVSGMASAFENAACVLQNAFARARQYPDYSGLYGASVCSSTVGGSPLSPLLGSNPFDTILPSAAAPASVTEAAKSAIDWMKRADPVLSPMASADVVSRLNTIVQGVSFVGSLL